MQVRIERYFGAKTVGHCGVLKIEFFLMLLKWYFFDLFSAVKEKLNIARVEILGADTKSNIWVALLFSLGLNDNNTVANVVIHLLLS